MVFKDKPLRLVFLSKTRGNHTANRQTDPFSATQGAAWIIYSGAILSFAAVCDWRQLYRHAPKVNLGENNIM
jgi:hypothetical protein